VLAPLAASVLVLPAQKEFGCEIKRVGFDETKTHFVAMALQLLVSP
jgi:hypothetical protein